MLLTPEGPDDKQGCSSGAASSNHLEHLIDMLSVYKQILALFFILSILFIYIVFIWEINVREKRQPMLLA